LYLVERGVQRRKARNLKRLKVFDLAVEQGR
jgi:hypothetical protein